MRDASGPAAEAGPLVTPDTAAAAADAAKPTGATPQAARKGGKGRRKPKGRRIAGMSIKRFFGTVVLPIVGITIVIIAIIWAPPDERLTIFLASLIAMAAGLAATSIGVYGGVLVPGLLLLGVDARFAAAASLFLQVLVIPLGAGAHYRLGNVARSITIPLVIGGMIGAFVGPFFAAALPEDVITRLVAAMIVGVGAIVLVTLRWGGGLGQIRPADDVPTARIAGVGTVAGFSSGISGAGWGPIGVKLLILLRIEPRSAIGSSLVGRVFMAIAAVVGYLLAATALQDVRPDYPLILVLFAGSVAAMVPGAFVLSRLGRETATIAITILSISLALPTLIWG